MRKHLLTLVILISSLTQAQPWSIFKLPNSTTRLSTDYIGIANATAQERISVSSFISTYSLTTNGTTGSGTLNFIPLWSSTTGFGNSYLSQSGRNIKLPSSRFITAYDTLGCQLDLSYDGHRKAFYLSTDHGLGNEAFLYGDSTVSELLFGNAGLTAITNQVAVTNSEGGFATQIDSADIHHTAMVSLKAPSVRVNGTLRINSGTPTSGKVWTATNTSGDGTWSTIGGTISGLTTNYLPIASSSSTLTNSSLSQTSGDVYIASGKKYYDATGVNNINLFDASNTIYLETNGSGVRTEASIDIGTDQRSNGELRFGNTTNTNTLTFRSGATGSAIVYRLPITNPTAGQVLTAAAPSVGVSNLSWATPATGSVTSIATGFGLTGGTITSTGTIKIDTTTGNAGGARPATQYWVNTSTSTLTNKTLTSPAITSPTITVGSDATGDLHYNGGSGALARLASVSAGSYLRSGGTSTAPLWSTLKLPNSATANYIPYATSSNTWGESSKLTFDGTTLNLTNNTAANTGLLTLTGTSTGNLNIGFYNGATYKGGVGYIMASGNIGFLNANYSAADFMFLLNSSGSMLFQDAVTSAVKMTLTKDGRMFIGGSTTPTSYLHLAAGTATASTAPLKFTSGTNLTTPETGAMEYNGTNLFFTRTGTTRENVLTTGSVNSVSPTSPNRTITVVIDGTTYYIAAKTTND